MSAQHPDFVRGSELSREYDSDLIVPVGNTLLALSRTMSGDVPGYHIAEGDNRTLLADALLGLFKAPPDCLGTDWQRYVLDVWSCMPDNPHGRRALIGVVLWGDEEIPPIEVMTRGELAVWHVRSSGFCLVGNAVPWPGDVAAVIARHGQ